MSTECPLLPLLHSTGYAVHEILHSNTLGRVGQSSKTVFFFYGKPSFSIRTRSKKPFLPFSLVVDTGKAHQNSPIKDIYCFDSGGFLKGHYDRFCSSNISLSEFRLGEMPAALPSGVLRYFGSNAVYLDPQLLGESTATDLSDTMERYLNLVKATCDPISEAFDPPAHTFEVQIPGPMPVKGTVVALLGPQSILSRPDFAKVASDLSVTLYPYTSDQTVGFQDNWYAVNSALSEYYFDQDAVPNTVYT